MSTSLLDDNAADVAEQPARTSKPSRPERRVMFDVMRLIAAYGIVWLHTPRSDALVGSTVLGRFAVPFFVCTTIYFVWQGLVDKPNRAFGVYAVSRFRRIYIPFLAWSVIYLAFKGVKAAALPDQPNDFPGWEFFWTGSFYHLWFMPFILVVTLAAFLLGRAVVRHPVAESVVAALGVVIGAAFALVDVPQQMIGHNGELVWNCMPAVGWGVALSVLVHRGAERFLQTTAASVAALCVAAIATAWIWRFGHSNLAENLAGVACAVVAMAPWNGPRLVHIGRFGPLAYGIYLSHLLWIKSAEALLAKAGAPNSWPVDLAVFVLAALGSTALAWGLCRTRYTRWLVA